ncbi:MAG TPA: DNA/RNA non-specific endonuclease [Allosphingosinicella sp.]|nr:DNA/RNA non-specific endonuclease [Allosphingosinicella sp.]
MIQGPRNAPESKNKSLIQEVAKVLGRRKTMVPPDDRADRKSRAESDPVFAARRNMIEDQQSDPNGFERIIGESDLMSINFLDRGRRSADAVCRIKLPMDGGHAYGTGFLVGPRLLMTNNHVLASAAEAAQAEAEFGFEHDIDGVLKDPIQFNLDPHQIFFTSTELDVTLVAVAPISESGVPIDRFGWLPLIPVRGKVLDGEWVSIIQHPGGQPKQIAIHASQIMKLDAGKVTVNLDYFIHYSTDTEPGSSGAPVLNDQWQVVALHHKAVPAPIPADAPRDFEPEWLANEGVRVSAIFSLLEHNRFENENARRALDRIGRAIGFPPLDGPAIPASAALPPAERLSPLPASEWQKADLGYDENFLTVPIPLRPMYADQAKAKIAAKLVQGGGHELKYFHYSAVMNAPRRFALLTAVNIDGRKLVRPAERKDTWRQDRRVAPEVQPDDDFYVRTKATEKVYFSRGHLVRLLDPCWSDATDEAARQADAVRGMRDSFHFTNAAPQVQSYNDEDWGNLEDYVLDKAQTSERRLSVFTGPVFRDDDPVYGRTRTGGPWQIPLSYWKIAVLQKTDEEIAAAAFLIGQTEYVQALYEAKVFSGLKPYTLDEMRSRKIQTTIEVIEGLTGLDFSVLKPFDAQGSLESTRKTRWFTRLDDVLI